MNRNLDGIFFRVKRGEKYENICFTDLTDEERDEICKDRSAEWFQTVAYHLADVIKRLGEEFSLIGE